MPPTPNPPTVLEPRFFARADLEVAVEVDLGGEVVVGRSVNVSEGGIAVRLARAAQTGAELGVAFELPGSGPRIQIRGRVVRAVSTPSGDTELAITFELADAEAAAVRALVAERAGIAWEPIGDALPREVAMRFIPLIRRVARSLAKRLPKDVAIDDLVGAGFVALVELYRQSRGVDGEQLERVALPRIRYAMLDELRDTDPLSRRMRRRTVELSRARAKLQLSLGRTPTRAELAVELGTSAAAIEETERLASSGASGTHASVDDVELANAELEGPEEGASRAESLTRLRTALDALPPRHRKVLELYYGEDLTLRQIGNLLGVTEARISQLVSEAVKKLRHEMPAS